MPRRNQIRPSGPWSRTNITDFYLDLWEAPRVPKKRTDRRITIEPKYHKKPRLLADDLWGDPSLWWVFSMRNVNLIQDPIEDFVAGKDIFLPDTTFINTHAGRQRR